MCATIFASLSSADDAYSNVVFTAVANNYWCVYGKVPRTLEDFAKVTDINDEDPRITLDPTEWLKSVKIIGIDKYTIKVEWKRKSGEGDDGGSGTVTTTSSCEPAT